MLDWIRYRLWKLRRRVITRNAKQSYNAKDFWNSWYDVAHEHIDAATISPDKDKDTPVTKYHYNTVENHIYSVMISEGYSAHGKCALDIGSGAGHWIEFWKDLGIDEVTAVDISQKSVDGLKNKYDDDPSITIRLDDFANPAHEYGDYDFVSAIGVLFHIVDDDKWETAVKNLCDCLSPGGIAFIGGEFGRRSANVGFHNTDSFQSVSERDDLSKGSMRVYKRLRSNSEWRRIVSASGCEILKKEKSQIPDHISTPQNNILAIINPVNKRS